jgi:hypothetical protein
MADPAARIISRPRRRAIAHIHRMIWLRPSGKRGRGGIMSKFVARLLSFAILFAVLLLSGGADPARAQSFPLPSKTLCLGQPDMNNPAACPAVAAQVQPNVPVFYQVTLGPNAPAGNVKLLENLPSGFTLVNPVVCKVTAGTNLNTQYTLVATGFGPTTLSSLPLQGGNQTVICFITGSFDRPGLGGVINSVTVADMNGNPVSSQQTHNAFVAANAALPTDLAVTKTFSPLPPLDVSGGPAPLTFTLTVKNNGPTNVYVGALFELMDQLSVLPTSVALQVQLDVNSIQCASTGGAHCLDTTPLPPTGTGAWNATAWTTVPTSSWMPYVKWQFPASGSSAPGYIPVNGTITMTYQLIVRRHPDIECTRGGDGFSNQIFFGLTKTPGITMTEGPTPGWAINNTATSANVPVITGAYVNDPDCGLPIPGVVSIKKKLDPSTTQPTNGFAWGTPIPYEITVRNSAPVPVSVRLRDISQEWAGTPLYDVSVSSWSCSPAPLCASPPPTVTSASLQGFYLMATVWDKAVVPLGAAGSATDTLTLKISLVYKLKSCDDFPKVSQKLIRNIARVNYSYPTPATNFMTYDVADVWMGKVDTCPFQVDKQVASTPNKIAFGPPGIDYDVYFANPSTSAWDVGKLVDAVRVYDASYTAGLPFTYSYSCGVVSGTITGPLPTGTVTGSGTIVHTTFPSQGARIIDLTGFFNFGQNSKLHCKVHVEIKRPAIKESYCQSEVQPRLENLGWMSPSKVLNASLPWEPWGTYNPALQSQPTPLLPWHTVFSDLPKCHRLTANKDVTPGLTWTPGGPQLNYTLTFTNAGDTLTSTTTSSGFSGPVIADFFLPGSPYTPSNVAVSSTCSGPPATWGNWSGAPAGYLSFLPVLSFPAGCRIVVTFAVPLPYKAGQICNRGGIFLVPQDSPDWYANDPTTSVDSAPNPATMQDQVCVDVLETYPLQVTKKIDNKAGAPLSGITFPVTVACSLAGSTYNTSTVLNLVDGGTQAVPNVPVGATCTVTEAWTTLPTPTESHCKPPSVAGWTAPVYSPASVAIGKPPAPNAITVANTIDCVKAEGSGILKVCKVAGPGIAVGTPFTFTAGSSTFSVPAGPAPGGTCVLGPSFAIGSTVTVAETLQAGITVSSIVVAPANRLVGAPNLPGGSVSVSTGSGVTEVTFTDKRTGYLEICKKGDAAGSFTVNPGGLGPFAVPAGACSPAIEVAAGSVVIQETPTKGAGMTECATIPAIQQGDCNRDAQTSTVTVAPGDISTMTIALITNGKGKDTGSLNLKKTITAIKGFDLPDLKGVEFPVDVACTPSGPSTTATLTADNPSQVIQNIAPGSVCKVTEQQPLKSTGTCPKPLISIALPPTYLPDQTVKISDPPVAASVEVNNQMACVPQGKLTVNKKMSPIPPGYIFPVTVTCLPAGPTQTVNLTSSMPSVTLSGLPANSKCTLKEDTPIGKIDSNCHWAEVAYPMGDVATIPAEGVTELSVQNQLVCK